jgi:CDP-6-deoxy-D-xylo-4-hexulose-3-dehydrase
VEQPKFSFAADTITREDICAWTDWLKSDPAPRLTMGHLVKEYEEKWSNWLGRKYSVACNSGSSANLLMYYALLRSGLLKNKKIIVPSAAWVTSVAPAIQLGFEPIMCEADWFNFGLNINHLRRLLSQHDPSAVMVVHALGVPACMKEIMQLKKEFKFFLLEDTCAAMGSTYQGQKLGTFGDMSSMSTYYGHQTPTVEGGMVTTDNTDFYNLLLMLRSHGWVAHLDRETRARLLKEYDIEDIGTHFHFIEPGFNFRFTDLQAFIGLRQLDRIDWIVNKRFENHQLYERLLNGYLTIQAYGENSAISSIHFCAVARNYKERNTIMRALENADIETRPYTSGNQGLQPYWFRQYGKFSAPIADRLYYHGFFLPNHPYLEKGDIEYICSVVIEAATKYRQGVRG